MSVTAYPSLDGPCPVPSESTVLRQSDPETWRGLQAAIYRFSAHVRMTDVTNCNDALALHLQGGVHLRRQADGKKQAVYSSAGDMCLESRLLAHSYEWDGEESTVLILSLSSAFLHHTIAEISTIDPTRVTLVDAFHFHDPFIHQIMLALHTELVNTGIFGQVYIETLGRTLVLSLLSRWSSIPMQAPVSRGRLSQQQIGRVRDYIYDHLAQGVSLAEMAACLNLSTSYFTRLFKETTGLSPYQYVIQCRVEQARHLLLNLDLTIVEIAQQVGFADQSHLHHHFKKTLGITPACLRGENSERVRIDNIRSGIYKTEAAQKSTLVHEKESCSGG